MRFPWIHAHDSPSVLRENPQFDISGEASKRSRKVKVINYEEERTPQIENKSQKRGAELIKFLAIH